MLPTTRDRLEAAVRATWSPADLAVYADYLQAEGDSRGELIALDLAVPPDRFRDAAIAWRERRHALIVAWVGGYLANWVAEHLWCGFFERVDHRAPIELFASPAGVFIRDFHAVGDAPLAALARQPRPWLARLVLPVAPSPIHDTLVEALVDATPNLELLEVEGLLVIHEFKHPRLRALRVTGEGAIGTLVGTRHSVFPAVTHLDLRYEPSWSHGDGRFVRYATRELFPALTHLDLSRNLRTDDEAPWLTDLGELPIRGQLTHLRAPAVQTPRDAAELAAALDRLPALVDVEVARGYGNPGPPVGAELASRRPPVIVPVAYPWPDPATVNDTSTLVVRIPDEPYDDIIALAGLLEFLEHDFEDFAPAARAAWSELWRQVLLAQPAVAPDDPEDVVARPLQLGTLCSAVDACDALDTQSWRDFRVHLRHACMTLEPTAEVSLFMYRGWSE
jgi:hypothetical protein